MTHFAYLKTLDFKFKKRRGQDHEQKQLAADVFGSMPGDQLCSVVIASLFFSSLSSGNPRYNLP